MKFSITDFFSKRDQIRKETADLVTFTEEFLNGKSHFLCSEKLVFFTVYYPFFNGNLAVVLVLILGACKMYVFSPPNMISLKNKT